MKDRGQETAKAGQEVETKDDIVLIHMEYSSKKEPYITIAKLCPLLKDSAIPSKCTFHPKPDTLVWS